MICPNCKAEYQEGYTKCTDCGADLIDNNVEKKSENTYSFFRLGETTAKKAISFLFIIGCFPLIFIAIQFGKGLYLANTYLQGITFMMDGQNTYTEKIVNNTPLGIFGGIAFFVIAILVWKITCELLIIIFRALETYIQKNKA